jgi:hypothetical protein
MINEDLRKWVAEKWVDIGAPKKGGGFKPCGRQEGEKRKGYPKCVPLAKAHSMSKGQRRSAVKRKRSAGNAGPKPTNVSTFARKNESMNIYEQIVNLINEVQEKRAKRQAHALYKIRKGAEGTEAESATRVAHLAALEKVEKAKEKRKKRLAAKGMTEKDAEAKGVQERYKKKIVPKTPDNVEDSLQRIGNLITEVAAWQRKEGKNPSGGLNKKGVESYRRENPGSKLKTAVTTDPSKLKKGSKAANRRKSFCARMGGMKKSRTSAQTANDPDSRINKALRKWNC